jgi:polysaccharide chain length determinant protein (PEP-CTERM system associated)
VIPGKKYKPEDLLEGAWRRRWFIVIPLVVIAAITMVVVRRLPDRYESSATMLIVPQRIPEAYVRSTVTTRLDERLIAIGQLILSRRQLEGIVEEFNLYPEERRSMIMEDVIEMMRNRDINFNVSRARGDSGSFDISFQYSNPRVAQQVATKLANLFVQENTQDRAVLAEQTDEFLSSQLLEVERQLKEREKQLEEFRRAHPGAMPANADSNQQALQNAQLQLQAVQESITRDRERQVTVQRQLADLAMAATMAPPAENASAQAPQTYARQLELAREAMKNLRLKLTADHPDIKALSRTIKELEQKAALEASQAPVSGPAAGLSPAELSRSTRISELQTEEAALVRHIAQRQEDERVLLGTMTTLRARLESAPTVESQLTELMRDYTTLQAQYTGLLGKSQDAKVAANLERRQIGEQFKMIDTPRLPQRPKSPDRLRMNLMGALGGLAVGLGFAALLEYRDTSLRSDDDVLVALALPVLATVPTMTTELERQRRKRHRLWLASSGAVALLLCIAAIMWKLRLNEWIW